MFSTTASSSAFWRLLIRGRSTWAARIVSSLSRSRAVRWDALAARGAATSAVTSTETTDTAQVTSTARAVRVRPKERLAIRGVPDAAYRPDDVRGVAELGPYLGHVDVDGPGTGERRVPPHRREQLLAGEHPARALHQVRQQVELGRRQAHQLARRE